MLGAGMALAACAAEPPMTTSGGNLSGQVVVSAPLRNATVSVDQIDLASRSTIAIRTHLADTTTDDEGRFEIVVGKFNGLFLITASGGAFTDLATGATIQLDPDVRLESITHVDLFDERDDLLVSPVGHLIATRTRMKLRELGDLQAAERDATTSLDRHFGNVDWTRIKLGSLDVPVTSPTEPVRAMLVQAALSYLAHDIAKASGATPQEVNVLTLTQKLAADIAEGRFDGNDGNSLAFGEGLQLGACAPVAGCTTPPAGACMLGSCRPLCDLYAGTPRGLLAAEMTSVIGLSTLNHTGLVTGDILAVARAMSDNVDDDLFGGACVENLDRLPPKLDWAAPTPGEMAYVRASFGVKVIASDDTDMRPQLAIAGYPYDQTDRTASATIDAATIADGLLELTATARDMAGNTALVHRTVRVDNTPPALALDPTGYLVEGATWWTAVASPTLAGSVTDAAPVTVAASTPAGSVNATVTGATWTASVAGALDLVGADVTITGTDAAGNRTQVTQHVRADVTPPQLTVQPSVVNDEALEVPTFDSNEVPVHTHTGAAVDLADAGRCPALTKFSYLLGAASPPYGSEVDDRGAQRRNPVHYLLVGADNGVGIAAGSTQYRVGFRTGNMTTWLLDWTASGPPTPIGPGVDQYDIGIYADQIPQLTTTEGIYDVEFRTTDRLARTTTTARCFDLHLRAPPLHFQTPGQGLPDPNPIPVGHAYRLQSLSLAPGAPFTAIAARLLDLDASGASLIDEDVTNGTASTVYLEVGVTKPVTVYASQRFVLDNFGTTRTVTLGCTQLDGEAPPPDLCRGISPGPVYTSTTSPPEVPITSLTFPVKVFELDATSLAPTTEVPCLVCGVGDRWKFALPPRPVGTGGPLSPRRFKVMTMIGPVSALWPSDGNFPASPPFRDTSLNGIAFTGSTSPSREGCTSHTIQTLPDGTRLDTCTRVATITPYRALTAVHIRTGSDVRSAYATAPTLISAPANITSNRVIAFSWDSAEGTLP